MRKTFTLGGATFSAPDPIGAGIRARSAQITYDIADEKKVKHEDAASIIGRYFYDYSLKLLELILKPESETCVKDAYDSATDEEVQNVMNFFASNASGKIISVSGKVKDSGNSKRTPKVSI